MGSRQMDKVLGRLRSLPSLVFLSITLTYLSFDSFGIGQYFSLLSFFAPIPLAMAILIYGRRQALRPAVMIVAFLILTIWFIPPAAMITISYLITIGHAFLLSLVLRYNVPPMKGVLFIGVISLLLLWPAIGLYHLLAEGGMGHYIAEIAKQLPHQEEVQIQKIIDDVYHTGPIYATITPFIILWLSLFFLIRKRHFWEKERVYSYSIKEMIFFRAPDSFIYILALGLGLAVLGNHYQTYPFTLMGNIMLGFVGVFYFFQGFGVFLDSLNSFKIAGLSKSLLVVFALLLSQFWLALLGILDTWFDLRKFLKKREDKKEGDRI